MMIAALLLSALSKVNSKTELESLRPAPVKGLKNLTMEGVAAYIKSGHAKNIIVIQGAGISTAAGIPDFRTEGTGLYAKLEKYKLPYPEAIFDISYFEKDLKPFYSCLKELYPGEIRPTVGHYLATLLMQKRVLKRLYTQNVDGLERMAGIPEDMLVEAHGTFETAHCMKCRETYNLAQLKAEYLSGKVVKCKRDGCDGIVKPDVVFFGESLPRRFFECRDKDFEDCDLLIVIGTALKATPFSSLINLVRREVPGILFNMEPVQTYTEDAIVVNDTLVDQNEKTGNKYKFKFNHLTNTRDVFARGDCQTTIADFVNSLGWADDLNLLISWK